MRLGKRRNAAPAVGQPVRRRHIATRESLRAQQLQSLVMRLFEDRAVIEHVARALSVHAEAAVGVPRNTRTCLEGLVLLTGATGASGNALTPSRFRRKPTSGSRPVGPASVTRLPLTRLSLIHI